TRGRADRHRRHPDLPAADRDWRPAVAGDWHRNHDDPCGGPHLQYIDVRGTPCPRPAASRRPPAMTQIAVGQPLPAFSAPSTAGEIDSRTLHGRPFVLYFYPKDNTPGCTTESQDFRDLYAQFQAADCAIF